ncbi:MAG: YraN family protein [Robiginitomaculum sp.]|nr:YraN family protein [Robiginitomaculum sp.]
MKYKTRKQAERKGRRAEMWAGVYLRLKGYSILETRYKTRYGEIDIIARKGNILAIVEVKRRQTLGLAHDALTAQSIKRIEEAGASYQEAHENLHDLEMRFDAIFITRTFHIHHLKDAWRTY